MYQQETKAGPAGKLFQLADDVIVVAIAVLVAASLPDFLQGVDDDKPGVPGQTALTVPPGRR